MKTLDMAIKKAVQTARAKMDEDYNVIKSEAEALDATVTKLEEVFFRVKEQETKFNQEQA